MSSPPRILIVTAAFGEGHNSAARNLALALEAEGAVTRVADPCSVGVPRLTAVVNRLYRAVTTHLPRVWGWVYKTTARYDFSRKNSPVLNLIERCLAGMMEAFKPDALVSTYPLYPYFAPGIAAKSGRRLPVFTVVTDSIEINAAWLRAPSDWWLVTDAITSASMVREQMPAETIVDTGFPVNPLFAGLQPLDVGDNCDPFKILYFPTSKLPFVRKHGAALLDASPAVTLTIVLGRNVRLLYRRAHELKRAYPERVRIIGWTRKVPQLLNSHHLVVGKAGGATVHEAIAACCPMLIHHLVPGQEEGNLGLLESIGGGALAESPEELRRQLVDILADRGARWRLMKNALMRHGCNAGAATAARFIIQHLSLVGAGQASAVMKS